MAIILYFLLIIFISISTLFYLRSKSPSRSNFPPGPVPLPVIGNLHQIPLQKPFLKFTRWSRTYGPIIGLHFGTQPVIILNSWRAVRDLLDQRGSVYSSRPQFPIVQYVVPGDLHLAFMNYDKTWRKARRTITSFLSDGEVRKLLPVQDTESTQMIWEMLHKPSKYYGNIMRQFGAVILAAVYGQRGRHHAWEGEGVVGPKGEGRTKQFFAIQDEWSALLDPGAIPPFHIFPFLKHIPDSLTPWRGWRERAETLKTKQSGLYKELFQETKERISRGKSKDSYVARLLEEQDKEAYSDLELEYIAGFLLEGGADTTATAFLSFIVAMAAYPDIQRKAQEEIDDAFGEDTLPREVDTKKLPYLQACFWETLRWRPGFPMAIPHATDKDDTYLGYFIPAGTTIMMNTWAIQHQSSDYPDHDAFDPSRYLGSISGVAEPSEDPDDYSSRRQTYAFGAGRRICAGQKMAENSMMLAMAKIIWAFDIAYAGEGKLDTNIETAWKDAILTAPEEVPLDFRVRGESRKETIEREWQRADAFLKRFE